MSEKRFVYGETDLFEWVEDNGEMISTKECVNKLNEQQATIYEQKIIIEEKDVANERLNRFLIEIGLEKEYIKWEFKKRCVE